MELFNSQEIQLSRFSTKNTKTIQTFPFLINLEDFKNCIKQKKAKRKSEKKASAIQSVLTFTEKAKRKQAQFSRF